MWHPNPVALPIFRMPFSAMAEAQASIDYIDWKQGFYDDVLAGRTKYYSNLLPSE